MSEKQPEVVVVMSRDDRLNRREFAEFCERYCGWAVPEEDSGKAPNENATKEESGEKP
jgi:hypothetical protein